MLGLVSLLFCIFCFCFLWSYICFSILFLRGIRYLCYRFISLVISIPKYLNVITYSIMLPFISNLPLRDSLLTFIHFVYWRNHFKFLCWLIIKMELSVKVNFGVKIHQDFCCVNFVYILYQFHYIAIYLLYPQQIQNIITFYSIGGAF